MPLSPPGEVSHWPERTAVEQKPSLGQHKGLEKPEGPAQLQPLRLGARAGVPHLTATMQTPKATWYRGCVREKVPGDVREGVAPSASLLCQFQPRHKLDSNRNLILAVHDQNFFY